MQSLIGHKVRINDPSNWYNGREAVITDSETYAGVTVCTVHIASETGNAVISQALRIEKLTTVEG